MELIKKANPDRWVFVCTFDQKDVAKQAGFRWNPDLREWWTGSKANAAKLASFCKDESAKADLLVLAERNLNARRDALAASRATDAAIDIPAPEGCEYLPYQKGGIAFAAKRFETLAKANANGGVLFGDEMGLGKTIQAIGTANIIAEIETICVVCPASLKRNWMRELKKWLVRPATIGIGDSKGCPDSDIVIINYEAIFETDKEIEAANAKLAKRNRVPAVKLKHLSLARNFDYLIIDEAHRIKNGEAKRTQAVEMIRAKRIAYLTGTPIPNRYREVWNTLYRLDPMTWSYTDKRGERKPAFWSFLNRYCGGRAEAGMGSHNGEELQEKMRTEFMVRRLKAEVLTDLPPKRRKIVEVTPTTEKEAEVIAAHKAQVEKIHADIERLQAEVELAKADDNEANYTEAVKKLHAATGVAFTEMAKVRHEEAVAIIPSAIEHLSDALEDPAHKVIVFAWHHDVIEAIASAFQDRAVVIYGETSLEDRDAAVQSFQHDPNAQLFVGSITAAGFGLTLTAASHVVFVEEDWVPGNVTQAEDRAHRISQKNTVLIEHLVFDDSIGAKMIQICLAKQSISDKALDNIIEIDEEEIKIPETINAPATKDIKREKVATEAANITPAEIADVHTALKILAGTCDWAAARDGDGFNKIDAFLGHSLADAPRLSAKQTVLGKKIIRKYKRQLNPDLYARLFPAKEELA